jgi:hypothetical protein
VFRVLCKLWKHKNVLSMETTGELDSSRRLVEFISSFVKGDCSFYKCPKARIVDTSFRLHISIFQILSGILHFTSVLRSVEAEINL